MEEKKKNIYETITAIMAEIPAIGKTKNNSQQGFKYRGIDDVMNALQPLMAKHKLFAVPETLGDPIREERTTKNGTAMIDTIQKVKYTFYAEDGSSVAATITGEGMDTADKSCNKVMAVAFKYALFQVFCIPTEEMAKADPDGHSPEETKPKKISYERRQKIVDRIKKEGIQNEYVIDKLKQHGYEKLADITVADVDQIEKEIIGE